MLCNVKHILGNCVCRVFKMTKFKIEHLPLEVIERILLSENLSFCDVYNDLPTCPFFYNIINDNNNLARNKFKLRFPGVYKRHRASITNFIDEIVYVITLERSLKNMVRNLASTCSYEEENNSGTLTYKLMEMDLLRTLVRNENGDRNFDYVLYILRELAQPYTRQIETCIRHRLAITVALTHLCQIDSDLYLRNFFTRDGNEIIEKWYYSWMIVWFNFIVIKYEDVTEICDYLTVKVQEKLRNINASHTLFKLDSAEVSVWKWHSIEENRFGFAETEQVLEALRRVFFKSKLDISINRVEGGRYNVTSPRTVLIKALRRKGRWPYTVAMLYESVARRLGVKLSAVVYDDEMPVMSVNLRGNDCYVNLWARGRMITPRHRRYGRWKADIAPLTYVFALDSWDSETFLISSTKQSYSYAVGVQVR